MQVLVFIVNDTTLTRNRIIPTPKPKRKSAHRNNFYHSVTKVFYTYTFFIKFNNFCVNQLIQIICLALVLHHIIFLIFSIS